MKACRIVSSYYEDMSVLKILTFLSRDYQIGEIKIMTLFTSIPITFIKRQQLETF